MTEEQKYYDLLISKISYYTLRELFYEENEKISDFLINSLVYLLKNKSGVKIIDSTSRNLYNFFYSDLETVIKITTDFVFTKDEPVKITTIEDEWVKVALFQQVINVSSEKVLYLSMKKDYLLSNYS